ncbi:MFS transporter [Acidicapsa ligni]|uniref:MFS transporter n=1 Tax=Acidicapsa ligni TaxID=542300 RepID=UPI0021DF4C52|nr:MFS transporter [Acidicapsa ligni]
MSQMTRPQKARWATALMFAVDGIGFGVWAAHIPVFKDHLHLSSTALSEVLLALVVGSIVTMPIAGQAISRFGSRRVVWAAASAYILAITGLSFVNSLWPLIIAAAIFGASKGGFDVSVNAQGVWVERQVGKRIMSSFQGFWSLGGLLGACLTSYALRRGGSTHQDFFRTCVALAICAIAACPFLLEEEIQPATKNRLRLPDPALLRLAGIAFLGLFAEGAMADWDGVYLNTSVGVSLSLAAIGYAAFSLSMAAGRFCGDWLLARLTPVIILRICGLFLFSGLAIALIFNGWWSSLIGFIFAGLGVANIVPVIWGAAGRNRVIGAGPALATVTTIGYFGFLAGPPIIGAVTTVLNVRLALIIVALFGVAIAASAQIAAQTDE